MSYGLVGIYGLYLMFVGINGNVGKLKTELQADFKPFMVWILAILILRGLYNVDVLKPVIKPFMGLVVLVFVLKNYTQLSNQVIAITGFNFNKPNQTVP